MKAQAAIDMIREAYRKARMLRETVHIVADTRKGYKITTSPAKGETVLFSDIVPPVWNDDLERAKIEAYLEFQCVEPALERIAEVAKMHPDSVDEIADSVLRQRFESIAEQAKHERPLFEPPPRRGLFTRLFGSSW